jgi:hypothetical protein
MTDVRLRDSLVTEGYMEEGPALTQDAMAMEEGPALAQDAIAMAEEGHLASGMPPTSFMIDKSPYTIAAHATNIPEDTILYSNKLVPSTDDNTGAALAPSMEHADGIALAQSSDNTNIEPSTAVNFLVTPTRRSSSHLIVSTQHI